MTRVDLIKIGATFAICFPGIEVGYWLAGVTGGALFAVGWGLGIFAIAFLLPWIQWRFGERAPTIAWMSNERLQQRNMPGAPQRD